jgi:hypothetical protein
MRQSRKLALVSVALLWRSACALPSIVTVFDSSQKSGPATIDWSDWGLTLSIAVVDDRVDYAKLASRSESLDRFLAHVGRVGPHNFPDQFPKREHAQAYYINCYNAAILRGDLELWRHNSAYLFLSDNIETRFGFRIDGRMCMPDDLRREALKLAGDDWRVRFALCDGTLGGPPLNRRAFLPEMLDAQLNEMVRSALASPQLISIQHGEFKQLVLWRGLFDIRDKVVKEYEQRTGARSATILNALLEWTPNDPVRRSWLNSAVGYEVVAAPTNRASNAVAQADASK